MANDIITYSSLTCPSVELENALRNIFCKFKCLGNDTITTYFDPETNRLTITVNGVSSSVELVDSTSQDLTVTGTVLGITSGNQVDLTTLVKLAETNTTLILDGTILRFTNEDGTVFSINLAPVVDTAETVTTLINNSNGISTYTNEAGVTTNFRRGGVSTDANNSLILGTDGLVYAAVIPGETITTITNTISGHKIADYTNENGAVVPIRESITTLTLNNNNTATYTNENGIVTNFSVGGISSNAGNDLSLGTDNRPYIDVQAKETTTTITNTQLGHKIADYTNEDGTIVAINEKVTTLIYSIDGTFTYTNENGIGVNISVGIPIYATLSSTGLLTSFVVNHSLGVTPTSVIVTPGSLDAQSYGWVAKSSTTITINYPVAPPVGTNNLSFNIILFK